MQLDTFPLKQSTTKKWIINRKKAEIYLLFLIWPFAAFLVALRHYHLKVSRNIIYLFLVLYGFTFVFASEGLDSYRYAGKLKQAAALPFTAFWDIVGGIYADDTSVDIVEPFIRFLVSRITDHPSLLFAVFALVFGYFYLHIINLLYDRFRKSHNPNALVHFLFFITIIPIFGINGFRFWTAAWVFFYGAYHVVLFKDKRFLWVSLAACLVHFSFLSANTVLLVYFFIGNRNIVYYSLVVLSFIIPDLVSPYLSQIADVLGGGLESRIMSYTNQSYKIAVSNALDETRWFMQWSGKLVLYYLFFGILFLKLKFTRIVQNDELQNLFSFMLFFLSFVNFARPVPSFGGRFQSVFFLFAVLFIFIVFTKMQGRKWHVITIVGLFPMALSAAIAFRMGAETLNYFLFAPTPFFFLGSDIALYDLIKDMTIYKLLFK
ncbi:MAG: EpsG family protein [Proteobacteria bacterium]|nr:EpsG family protein [Pseudomonadota bacterium]